MRTNQMDKIQTFFGKLAYRAIAGLLRINRTYELADMWYTENLLTQRQEKCEEVNNLFYLVYIIIF